MIEGELYYIDPRYRDDGKSIDKLFYCKVLLWSMASERKGERALKVSGDTYSISLEMKRTLKKLEDEGYKISYGPRYFKFEW
jgi:hypothetical protein